MEVSWEMYALISKGTPSDILKLNIVLIQAETLNCNKNFPQILDALFEYWNEDKPYCLTKANSITNHLLVVNDILAKNKLKF